MNFFSTKLIASSLISLSLLACGDQAIAPSINPKIDEKLNAGNPVANSGNVAIKDGYIELLKRINPGIANQIQNPTGKKKLIDNLIEQELLYKESLSKGLQNDPLVQEKLAVFSRVIIAQALVDKEVDNQAREAYEKDKNTEYLQVKTAHIFFSANPMANRVPDPKTKPTPPTPAEIEKAKSDAKAKADAVSAELKAGTLTWEKAIEKSDDKLSAKNGGEIGYLTKSDNRILRMDWKALVEKAFAMKTGEISEPILAKDGYHIVKQIEAPGVKKFEEVENAIKYRVRPKVKDDMINRLGGGKINYQDESLSKLDEAPAKQAPMPMGGMPGSGPGPKK